MNLMKFYQAQLEIIIQLKNIIKTLKILKLIQKNHKLYKITKIKTNLVIFIFIKIYINNHYKVKNIFLDIYEDGEGNVVTGDKLRRMLAVNIFIQCFY